MIRLERTNVVNFDAAVRGMRNPLNSWAKNDSYFDDEGNFVFGPNDLDLGHRLCKAGTDHRKFVRQIFISVDITAPMYWWKEFDTYKVGTVANSTSTMHTIHKKPFAIQDFSAEDLRPAARACMEGIIEELETLRLEYNESKDKDVWRDIIQLLPSSYNQMRTVTMSYENAASIYRARKGHKLTEWKTFCDWVEELPYFRELFLAD
ncbi:MAG: hypothetical protein ACOYCA_00200 [Eggerthellaceae bacterium]|jgi:hypothetical protein